MQNHLASSLTLPSSTLSSYNHPKWTNQLLSRLLYLTSSHPQNWKNISKSFPLFCENTCRLKYDHLQALHKKTPWSPDEEQNLLHFAQDRIHINWFDCSVVIRSRSPDDCRRRFSELKSKLELVGDWGYEEQVAIFRFVRVFSFSWKKIAEMMPGRNQNSVKSFFHSTIRRIKKSEMFKFLKVMVTWPTYTNKSRVS